MLDTCEYLSIFSFIYPIYPMISDSICEYYLLQLADCNLLLPQSQLPVNPLNSCSKETQI